MICSECRTEIDPLAVICPGCGARVGRDRARREQADWREQVRETVERHRLKKRKKLEERDDDARQLSIFPEPEEDDEARAERQRRAEIRQRVEERVSRTTRPGQRRRMPPPDRPDRPGRPRGRIELGELPLRSGASAARDVVARRDSSSLALDRSPEVEKELEADSYSDRPDPTTVELEAASESSGRRGTRRESSAGRAALDLPLGNEAGARDAASDDASESESESETDVELDFDADADGEGLPGHAPFDFGLAPVGGRILSGIIDLVFVVAIQLTLFYLTTHLVSQRIGALPSSALAAMSVVGAVLTAGYFLFFWALSGQTLGKLLTGARVVDRRGRALGFAGAAARLAGLVLAVLPLGAGFIGLWTDPERRGWHDRIAGTKVVRG